jgi:hypothetical protein
MPISRAGFRNSFFGKKHTDSAKAKMSAASRGRKPNQRQIERSRQFMTGRTLSMSTREKISKALTGRKYTQKTIELMSFAALRRSPPSVETRKKMSISQKKRIWSNSAIQQIRNLGLARKGKPSPLRGVPKPDRSKYGLAWCGKKHKPESLEKISKAKLGKKNPKIAPLARLRFAGIPLRQVHKDKIAAAHLQRWRDPLFRTRRLADLHLIHKKNKFESKIENIIRSLGLDYSYTGSGATVKVVGHHPPDFISNKNKKAIECNGLRWHIDMTGRSRSEEEQHQKRFYSSYGWSVVSIWQDDTYLDIVERLLLFGD